MAVMPHQGKWKVEIWNRGRRVYTETGFPTKLDAQVAEREYRENLSTINTDFIKLSESRMEELELKRSKGHAKENQTLFKNLIKRWGTKKKITREDVEKYLNEVSKESKPKANKHLRLIKALFNHGVKRGWLKSNPAFGIDRFPEEKKKRYIPPEADIRKVLDLAKPMDRLYLLVVAHTLGRIRSVNNLKWEDVHEDYVSLYTRKSKNSDLKEIRVPMNDVLREVLKVIPVVGEYVFTNPLTERPYDYRDKFLPRLCRLAGVRPFMYHAFRHFGASKLDNQGVPITDIQELLGHERATTTDHYLQSLRGSVKDAVKKLEGLR